jgi:hypothetical protein
MLMMGISAREKMPRITLKPYQAELVDRAVNVIHKNRMVYLAMETRTGKTPVSIMTAYHIASEIGNPSVLFATKKAAMKSIRDTYEQLTLGHPELAQISLEVVSMDSLHNVDWQPKRVLIIDESHGIGAFPKPSKRAVSLAGLSRDCIVLFLSATPTPESYSQIYHQLWAARSSSGLIYGYKNFYAWARDYVRVKDRRIAAGRTIRDYSDAKKENIMPYLDELTVSITKLDAGFKQHRIDEHIYWVPMPLELAQLIKKIKKDRVITIESGSVTADTAAAVMSKTHQLCSGTVINDNGDGVLLSTHKLDKLKFLMAMYPKLVIFYKYIAEHDALLKALGSRATESPEEFEKSTDKVFIGQYLSKREGINLCTADAIVFFNIDFAYVSYIQAMNRIMNLNREKKAVLIWMFTKGGIEQDIYEVVKQKKNFTESYFKKKERIK